MKFQIILCFLSQLITETVASGGDRFGKLFELMDQLDMVDRLIHDGAYYEDFNNFFENRK